METFLQPSTTAFPIKYRNIKTSTPKPCKKFIKEKHNLINTTEQSIKTIEPKKLFEKNNFCGDNIIEEQNLVDLKDSLNSNLPTHKYSTDLDNCFDENNISLNLSSSKLMNLENDNKDWRSISPSSSFNGSLNESLSTMTPDYLRQKYDLEFRDAFNSDLNILMDKHILDTCQLTKEESFNADDLLEFGSQYNELVAWLKRTLSIFSSKATCFSERHVNQECGEEMLQKLKSRENFEYYATRMLHYYPAAMDDIKSKREEVNILWNQLKEIMNPAPQTISHLLIYKDVEEDMKNLNNWICKMQEQIDHISKEFKNQNSSWQNIKNNISMMILELDRQFKCLTSITNVCNRMIELDSLVQEKFLEFHQHIPIMQQQCQSSYLQLLEWQLKLDSDQFVPRDINLEEIVEESEESFESLYDENFGDFQIPSKNKISALDRRVSTSAPSLQDRLESNDIQSGNLSEIEQLHFNNKKTSVGTLRRTDIVKDLSNFLRYDFAQPIDTFEKLNCESMELHQLNADKFENLKKLSLENCCVGAYIDVGYSTDSKSPPSTENCSDSSGIVANNYLVENNISKDKLQVMDTNQMETNILEKQKHESSNNCEANCISASYLKIKNHKDLYDNNLKDIIKAEYIFTDDMIINSNTRKRKKKRKNNSGSLNELNQYQSSPKFMRRCFSDNCHIANKTRIYRKREYNSEVESEYDSMYNRKIRRTLFKEIKLMDSSFVDNDNFEVSDNETCRSFDSSSYGSENLDLQSQFHLTKKRYQNISLSDSEEEELDYIIKQSLDAIQFASQTLNNNGNTPNYKEIKATCNLYIKCLADKLHAYSLKKIDQISLLKEIKLRWIHIRNSILNIQLRDIADNLKREEREISILVPLHVNDFNRIEHIVQYKKNYLEECNSNLEKLEEEMGQDINCFKELNSQRIILWNISQKVDKITVTITMSKELLKKFDSTVDDILKTDILLQDNQNIIQANKLLDEQEIRLRMLLKLYVQLSEQLPYTSLSNLREHLESSKEIINASRCCIIGARINSERNYIKYLPIEDDTNLPIKDDINLPDLGCFINKFTNGMVNIDEQFVASSIKQEDTNCVSDEIMVSNDKMNPVINDEIILDNNVIISNHAVNDGYLNLFDFVDNTEIPIGFNKNQDLDYDLINDKADTLDNYAFNMSSTTSDMISNTNLRNNQNIANDDFVLNRKFEISKNQNGEIPLVPEIIEMKYLDATIDGNNKRRQIKLTKTDEFFHENIDNLHKNLPSHFQKYPVKRNVKFQQNCESITNLNAENGIDDDHIKIQYEPKKMNRIIRQLKYIFPISLAMLLVGFLFNQSTDIQNIFYLWLNPDTNPSLYYPSGMPPT